MGAHLMVIYAVDRGGLAVADPNHPGNTTRRILYAGGAFQPYESAASRAEIDAGQSIRFDTIAYIAKTADFDWTMIVDHWSDVKDGTIGDDWFPEYSVQVQPSPGVVQDLENGYVSPTRDMPLFLVRQFPADWRLYLNGVETPLASDGTIRLADGNNRLGILVLGDADNNPQKPNWQYVDFKYFNVVYGEEEPAPSDIPYVKVFCGGRMGCVYEKWREEHNYTAPSAWSHLNIQGQNSSEVPIAWNGLNFSGGAELVPFPEAQGTGRVEVSGTLSRSPSPTEPTLLTLRYTETYDVVHYDWHEVGTTSFVITNIPLDANTFTVAPDSELRAKYQESSGAAMQKYLTSVLFRLDTTWLGPPNHLCVDEHWTYNDATCCGATGVPGESQTEFTIILLPPHDW